MQKRLAIIVVLVMLALPVGAQSLDFLVSLMKTIVEEYGIEQVIGALEELGYIGEGEVSLNEEATEHGGVSELTARSALWDDPDGEETLAYMVVSDEPNCYSYLDWGRDPNDLFSLAEQMKWRQRFINDCITE